MYNISLKFALMGYCMVTHRWSLVLKPYFLPHPQVSTIAWETHLSGPGRDREKDKMREDVLWCHLWLNLAHPAQRDWETDSPLPPLTLPCSSVTAPWRPTAPSLTLTLMHVQSLRNILFGLLSHLCTFSDFSLPPLQPGGEEWKCFVCRSVNSYVYSSSGVRRWKDGWLLSCILYLYLAYSFIHNICVLFLLFILSRFVYCKDITFCCRATGIFLF